MLRQFALISALGVSCVCAQTIGIRVTETAGIRRTAFPVDARVHIAQGALASPANARLSFGGKETPAQYSAESLWPDGSVEWLDVDWNASIGPGETQAWSLEHGSGVSSTVPGRGLTVTEDADGIQAGSIRFSKSGSPLLASVKYRGEEIGPGTNGLFVTDDAGQAHDLSTVSSLKTEIVKRGPLVVSLRYSGSLIVDGGYSAPFVVTVEMPSSKTMVRISATVDDPARRLREIGVATPLALGALPWVWDFGTSRWTYGSMRNAGDAVTLTQTAAGDWTVQTGPKGKEQLYEKSSGRSESVQWGHLSDGKEVVAFGVERREQQNGIWRVSLTGNGQVAFRFAPSAPAARHEIAVFEHFVTTPVQIGAATSPSALLSPLKVEVDRH